MDTTSTTTSHDTHKSELDKFKLFYEIATPTHEVRKQIRRNIVRK